MPFIALDLRENFVAETKADVTYLGACAQQLLLMQLHGLWQQDVSAQALGGRLGASKMTVSRAYRKLSEFSLAHLSLHSQKDERIHIALDEMMQEY